MAWHCLDKLLAIAVFGLVLGGGAALAGPFRDPIASPENPSPGAHKKLS